MTKLLVVFTVLFTIDQSVETMEVTCDDFKGKFFMQGMTLFDRNKREVGDFNLKFSVATEMARDPLTIDSLDVKSLGELNYFDPVKKTYIVIHGFWSNGNASWVNELKDAILDTVSSVNEKQLYH